MTPEIYCLVYCSRNLITGDSQTIKVELEDILTASRRNNVHRGITGALLYNAGCFAQVLEGPLAAVERVFEVIQRDPRHSDVTVIQSEIRPSRMFPEWSMAFFGTVSESEDPVTVAAFESAFAHVEGAGDQMLQILKDVVVSEHAWVDYSIA